MDSTTETLSAASSARVRRAGELSYKFQRLRERLRQAIVSGELSGKLPGERMLAKKYNCNAKTLSKALTDLAAEGLLDRSIGRGTYVKGSAPVTEEAGPWLVLGEGTELEGQLVRQFIQSNPRCQLVVGEPQKRPSFVNQFSGVIDVCSSTPESFLRDLVVRGIPVVVIGREGRSYSMDSVMIDHLHGVNRLVRDLHAQGHRRFVAVEPAGKTTLTECLRQAVSRPSMESSVDTVAPNESVTAVKNGATTLVCDSEESAAIVSRSLENAGISVPAQVSVVIVGVSLGEPSFTGCYVSLAELAENAIRLLQDSGSRRPTTLWLAPAHVDRKTVAPAVGYTEHASMTGVSIGQ